MNNTPSNTLINHIYLLCKDSKSAFVSRTVRDGGYRGKQAHEDGLHARPAAGAREGVPIQPLHLEAAPRGAGSDPEPHRAPHQDLVPEPAHEVEEGGGPEEGEGV